MSLRTARCPNCGADVEFRSAGAVTIVCDFCGASSYRTDVDLELIGKVAARAELASHFQRGTRGRHDGRPFEVRGQLQLDHGLGVWNEWCAETEEGDWLWIAEAQGELWVLEEIEHELELSEDKARPGMRVKLGGGERFLVTEVGEGQVLTAAGELPFRLETGESTRYADAQRGADEVASIDWTREAAEVLAGRRVRLEALELDPLTQPEHRPDKVPARRIDCTECGAALELRDPENSKRIACGSCGQLYDTSSEKVRAVEAQRRSQVRNGLPIGTETELRGEGVVLLGLLERAVYYEGTRYAWREYLLKRTAPGGGYQWLVENDGHWALARPCSPAEASTFAGGNLRFRGKTYKHFSTGDAKVELVLGECYWDVAVGETVKARDFVSGPRMVSTESGPTEIVASCGEHLELREIEEAFPKVELPRPKGVGMVQPNPRSPRRAWRMFALAAGLLIALRIGLGMTMENRVVLEETFGPTPMEQEQQTVQFSELFELTAGRGNVRVEISSPQLDNGWVGVLGALVEEDTGQVITFDASAQYYHGVSGGESWKEGSRRGSTTLGSVPAGTYRLRVASTGWDNGRGKDIHIRVRSQVPRTLFVFLGILILLVGPVYTTIRWFAFEASRWSSSDHPWLESE